MYVNFHCETILSVFDQVSWKALPQVVASTNVHLHFLPGIHFLMSFACFMVQ